MTARNAEVGRCEAEPMTEEKLLALAASFGPVLKAAFPDHHPVTRFQVANALVDEIRQRIHWFREG